MSDQTIIGTSGNNNLSGGSGDDVIDGGAGNDHLSGGAGSDTLLGGAGDDKLSGGSGDDTLNGGANNDNLVGGSGNDTLDGDGGNDSLNGDAGNDLLIYNLSENLVGATDVYTGGSGVDTLRLELTSVQWLSADVQTQLARYVQHLATVARSAGGEVSNGLASDFTFTFAGGGTLKVQMTEWLEIFVDGANVGDLERPFISSAPGSGAVVEDADETASPTDATSASGSIGFFDVNWGNTHSVSVAAPGGAIGSLAASITNSANGDGVGTVGWTYTLGDAASQSLAAGQTKTEVFNVTITDNTGRSATQAVTITVTGTNDAPVLSVDANRTLAEDGGGGAMLTESGALAFVDVDAIDTHAISHAYNADAVWSGGSLSAGQIATLSGGFSAGAGAWNYDVANSALQFLDSGETVTLSFSVTVTDSSGAGNASVTETVTITITGADDQPTLAAVAAGSVAEDRLASTTTDAGLSGMLVANDVDGDVLTYGIDGGTVSAGVSSLAAAYGTLSVDTVTGTYSYTKNAAAIESLDDGEVFTDSFTVTVSDGDDGPVSQTFSVTITGADDQPTLAAVAAGSVSEDRLASTTSDAGLAGMLVANDVDGDALSYGIDGGTVSAGVSSLAAAYGTLSVDTATGAYTYTKNPAAIETLDDGEMFTDSFTVTVSDGDDGPVTQTFNVTVTGADDQPTLAAVAAGSVAEERLASTTTDSGLSGMLVANDVDGDALTYGIDGGTVSAGVSSLAAAYGTLSVDTATGAYSYVKDAAAIEALDDSEVFTESFTVTVSDGDDGPVTQTLSVTITGADDQPTLASVTAGSVAEDRLALTTTDGGLSGMLAANDVDGDALTFGIDGGAVSAGAATLAATYGTLTVNTATGAYSYTKNTAAIEALDDGEIFTDSFAVTVSDGDDGPVTQTFNVTVTGADDQPTLATVAAGSVSEDRLASTTSDTGLSGMLVANDVDGDAQTYGIDGGAVSAGMATLAATYGTLSVDTATGAYSYNKNAAAIEALDDGESFTENFTVTVSDGDDGPVTQTFSVTVTGADDQPTFAAVAAGSVAEDRLASTTTDAGLAGMLAANDVDGDTLTYGIDGGTISAGIASRAATYGTLSVDTASGAYSYTQNTAAIEALDDGESFIDSFTVTVNDGDDGPVRQTFSVTVTGADDQPTLAAVTAGSVAEDRLTSTTTDSSLSGMLVANDVDGDVLSYGIDGGTVSAGVSSLAAAYGTLSVDTASGAYSYIKNAAAIEALDDGEVFTDSFTVTVDDADDGPVTQTFSVAVTGADDQPTLAAVAAGSVVEDRLASTTTDSGLTGTLVATDVDGDALTYGIAGGTVSSGSSTFAATYGTLSVHTATGAYTYTKNPAAIEALDDGEVFTDSFTATVSDGDDGPVVQTFAVIVTGADDQPTLAAVTAGAIAEVLHSAATTDTALTGTLAGADVDGDALTYGIVGGTVAAGVASMANSYGTLSVDTASGAYSFAKNAAAIEALRAGQSASVSFTVSVSDGDDALVTQPFTIAISGANDAPMLADTTDPVAVAEAISAAAQDLGPIAGSFAVSDADIGDTLAPAQVGAPQVLLNGGAFTLPAGAASLVAAGAFTLTGALSNGGTTSIGYSWDPAAANLDFLAADDTLTIGYAVKVDDGSTDSATQDVTFTITGSNDAPVLSAAATPMLNAVNEDAATPVGAVGTLVSSLVNLNPPAGGLDNVSDADAGAVTGIALVATANSFVNGFYSLDNGANWSAVGSVSNANALLLAADATTRVYFQPTAADFNGTVADAITFRAWDQTSGTAGTKVDTGSGGGTSAFSAATDTAAITVTAVNDAPAAAADTLWVTELTTVRLSLGVLLGNDTDIDGLALAITGFSGAVGALGTPVNNGDGTFSFTTTAVANTSTVAAPSVASFSYTLSDGSTTTSGSVTVNIVATDNGSGDQDVVNLSTVATPYQAAYLDGRTATDTLTDGASVSVLVGGAGGDTLNGNDGADRLRGGAGGDNLNGGNGIDLLDFSDATSGITLTFVSGSGSVNNATTGLGNDNYTGVEGVIGSATANDNLTGSNQDDVLWGLGGTDTLSGGNGNDTLRGGAGNDTINGGSGTADLIDFGDGTAGITFTLTQAVGLTSFNASAAGLGTDQYQNIEGVIGTSHADNLAGSALADRIAGGGGADTLTGNAGADTFVFHTAPNSVDTITDFSSAEGDKIELALSLFAGIGSAPGPLAATDFASVADGSGAGAIFAATVNVIYDSATGNLYYDANGSDAAGRSLFATVGTLTHPSLVAADFTVGAAPGP